MKITIPYHLTASAGDSGFETIFTVPAGKKITILKTQIKFPSGTNGELYLALYYGNTKVAPYTGYWVGDDWAFVDEMSSSYQGGDSIVLYYNNTNTTESKEAYLLITAELE